MKNYEFPTVATQLRTQANELFTAYVPHKHYGQPFWEAQNSQHMHHRTAWTELRWPFIEKTKASLLALSALFAFNSQKCTCVRKVTLPELDSEAIQQFSPVRESQPQESW